ncbi:MAG: carbamoyltransferase, partial [Endomicrobiia bacterium]
LSHAASSYYCSPFNKSAIITIDGIGDGVTTSIGIGENNKIKILKKIYFPHSLGLFYSSFTAFLGFEINDGEYKVMGMAPYGKPRYVDKVKKLIKLYPDGTFELNMDYFEFHYSTKRTYNKKFEELFGKPRDPNLKFFTSTTPYPSYFGEKPSNYDQLCKENEYYADIAASIQKVLEEAIINLANAAYKETKINRLCLGGGVSLNSVANYKILQNTPFKEIYIQPAATDAGGALGAALYVYNIFSTNPKRFVLEHAFWGKQYTDAEIKNFLDSNNIKYIQENEEKIIDITVDALSKGKVVGWFQERFEWGPRALGNRSILADPRRQDMKDIVNTKIKFREPYRPFAPSVLIEKTEEYFDIKQPEKHYPARFMLYVVNVKENKRDIIPAVTHVDGSGRLQTVSKQTNPKYYKLIKKFEEATGVPVILNTSFNLKGEPIVNSPEDAIKTFYKSEMDTIVLENFIIKKNDF